MTVYPRSTSSIRTTSHDALATLFVGGAVGVYLLATTGTAFGGLSTRQLAAIALGLGMAACMTVGQEMQAVFTPGRNGPMIAYLVVASLAGTLALAMGIGVLITGSAKMLDVLVPTIVALWLLATVRHASARTRE